MVIVFEPRQKKQKMFFWGVTVLLVFILFIVTLVVFPPGLNDEFQKLLSQETPQSKIGVSLNIVGSNMVKNLEPFGDIEPEFVYTVKGKDGKQVQGSVSALTILEAKNLLEKTGFQVLKLEKATTGKNNPFSPYYQLK